MTIDDEIDAALTDALLAFCSRCGRELNLQGECGNIYCQQAAAADGSASEPAHRHNEMHSLDDRGPGAAVDVQGSGASLACDWKGHRSDGPRVGFGYPCPKCGRISPLNAHQCARARDAKPVRGRKLWRGVNGGQSVVALQVMGEMWSAWQRWGDVG